MEEDKKIAIDKERERYGKTLTVFYNETGKSFAVSISDKEYKIEIKFLFCPNEAISLENVVLLLIERLKKTKNIRVIRHECS